LTDWLEGGEARDDPADGEVLLDVFANPCSPGSDTFVATISVDRFTRIGERGAGTMLVVVGVAATGALGTTDGIETGAVGMSDAALARSSCGRVIPVAGSKSGSEPFRSHARRSFTGGSVPNRCW
jgi:hypothetical protein